MYVSKLHHPEQRHLQESNGRDRLQPQRVLRELFRVLALLLLSCCWSDPSALTSLLLLQEEVFHVDDVLLQLIVFEPAPTVYWVGFEGSSGPHLNALPVPLVSRGIERRKKILKDANVSYAASLSRTGKPTHAWRFFCSQYSMRERMQSSAEAHRVSEKAKSRQAGAPARFFFAAAFQQEHDPPPYPNPRAVVLTDRTRVQGAQRDQGEAGDVRSLSHRRLFFQAEAVSFGGEWGRRVARIVWGCHRALFFKGRAFLVERVGETGGTKDAYLFDRDVLSLCSWFGDFAVVFAVFLLEE